jgi:chaperonin GroES
VEAGSGNVSANGVVIPMAVQKGDTVLLPEYGGSLLSLNHQEYFIYRDTDVLGIL